MDKNKSIGPIVGHAFSGIGHALCGIVAFNEMMKSIDVGCPMWETICVGAIAAFITLMSIVCFIAMFHYIAVYKKA